ncbi:MAG: MarR family transcriptional regulator [Armatimonadota bacterium]
MEHDPLDQQAEQLSAAVSRLIRALNALSSEEVEGALTIPQARVCGLLRGGPQPMTALSRELGISLSAVTQIADRLEHAGLVSRAFSEDDRRVRLLQLTDAGQQRMQTRHARRLERARAIVEALAPDEREAALTALAQWAEAAGRAVVVNEVDEDGVETDNSPSN